MVAFIGGCHVGATTEGWTVVGSLGVSAVECRSWWFRPAAWPDGKLLNPNEDRMTRVWMWATVLLVAVQSWVLGRSDTLDVAIGDSLWILSGGLVAAVTALWVMAIRMRVVQAVVEGWVDDREPGFIQGRLAAVAVDAKRARARFASASG